MLTKKIKATKTIKVDVEAVVPAGQFCMRSGHDTCKRLHQEFCHCVLFDVELVASNVDECVYKCPRCYES